MRRSSFIIASLLFGVFHTTPHYSFCGSMLIGFPLPFLQSTGHYVDQFKSYSPPNVQWPSIFIFNPKILFLDLLLLVLIGMMLSRIFKNESSLQKNYGSYLPMAFGLYWIISIIFDATHWLYGSAPNICYVSGEMARGLYNFWQLPVRFVTEFIVSPIYEKIPYENRTSLIQILKRYPPLLGAFPAHIVNSLVMLISFPIYLTIFSLAIFYSKKLWRKK